MRSRRLLQDLILRSDPEPHTDFWLQNILAKTLFFEKKIDQGDI